MNFFQSPQYFGTQDNTVDNTQPFRVRIYYPTDDDVIVGAPLPPGPHPLVVFAHGARFGPQNAHLCPPDFSNDNCRWTVVLGAIARSGFVVAAPALGDVDVETSVQRLAATIRWMRTQWNGRHTLHVPLEVNPGIGVMLRSREGEREADLHTTASDPLAMAARIQPPVFPGEPTALALVGHSWGARACAQLAVNGGVQALAAIAGTFDDNLSIEAIRNVRIPTLLMCGTADEMQFSYLGGLWSILPTPKYQAAFKEVEHWDWFGRHGAIRRCNGSAPAWPDSGHIAGELLAGFLTRHIARLPFDPPHLVRIPLLRPWLLPWYDHGSAIQMRWDAPGEQFYSLPPAGDGILGPWTAGSAPW